MREMEASGLLMRDEVRGTRQSRCFLTPMARELLPSLTEIDAGPYHLSEIGNRRER